MIIRTRYNLVYFLLVILNLAVIRSAFAQDIASLPAERVSILQYIMDDRPVLVSLLTTAGLVPVLSGDAPHTLLMPPEKQLESLKKESPDKIRSVLSGYILKGSFLERDLKDGASVEALNGKKLKICRKDGTLINGVLMSKPNHEVRNGVVHQLQDMLK
jgi:uncharacterized surface protein with fasciclin (FAS1) repeats